MKSGGDLLLQSGEAARVLEVSPEQVRRFVRLGQLRPAARTTHGLLLFTAVEIERLRAERAERRQAKEMIVRRARELTAR
jgi:DNA-binding transcriptional MerR regulator